MTHAIRRGIPPIHNFSSKGGTHIHHSTFGIYGLLGVGNLWTYRIGVPRSLSRLVQRDQQRRGIPAPQH